MVTCMHVTITILNVHTYLIYFNKTRVDAHALHGSKIKDQGEQMW